MFQPRIYRGLVLSAVTVLAGGLADVSAQTQSLDFLNGGRSVVDAHNCYPYEGKWSDRVDRALKTGLPVAIEQDLAWVPPTAKQAGRVVVSHQAKTTGSEPDESAYFFEKVRPLVEKELTGGDASKWPLIVLHFDFKDQRPELLRAVWDLLGKYESWITTAPKTANPQELAAFDRKPILVLTEDSDKQEEVFFHAVPIGARLRLFGSVHTNLSEAGHSHEELVHLAATLPPEQLLTEHATNYRRWWNNSWYAVEEGGQPHAGDWTEADGSRLRSLVSRAHALDLWIRFYTLDGFTPATGKENGWFAGYNFGSIAAVRKRWEAAIQAGVNLIASDQYEDLAATLHGYTGHRISSAKAGSSREATIDTRTNRRK